MIQKRLTQMLNVTKNARVKIKVFTISIKSASFMSFKIKKIKKFENKFMMLQTLFDIHIKRLMLSYFLYKYISQ